MAITDVAVQLTEERLGEIQRLLTDLGIDGWLIYDFRGTNPIAGGLLGLPPLTRRYFVVIPATGVPVALTHRIEQQPWREWPGEKRVYLSWESLGEEIERLVAGFGTLAAEYSPEDAIPYMDRMPAGVHELIRSRGVELVSSGDLVSALYSRWTPEGEASHMRAAHIVGDTAREAFAHVGDRVRAGEMLTEWGLREWVVGRLESRGLRIGCDAVVAVNANAANPHYAPGPAAHAAIRPGDLLLLDLWGKENERAVYADQTWMAFLGANIPERIQTVWDAVRDARVHAVETIRKRTHGHADIAGFEVDEAARELIRQRGFADAFLHRTGHSIDVELHGSGPNVDNLETRDTRRLIPGVGFSIEPGIYLEGEFGIRSEVNVFMRADGPLVTTPDPQKEIHLISID